MSTTTTINPATSNSDGKGKTIATHTATAAAAAGLGAAAAMAMDNHEGFIVEPVSETPIEELSPTQNAQPEHTGENSGEMDMVQPDVVVEPDIVIEPDVEVEPVDINGTEVGGNTANGGGNITNGGNNQTNEEVNPDEIAQAIISEEQIDPDDIDMADVINFEEIGSVYTVEGESYVAAAFRDDEGNQLIMIDVDGDNVFDVITDQEGNLVAEVPVPISVGDAEEAIEDDIYLAHDEMDDMDEYGIDSLAEDLNA